MPKAVSGYTFKIFITILCLLLIFSLASCASPSDQEEEVKIAAIAINTSTIPQNAIATQVELSDIKLIVKLTNNREREISLNQGMIYMSDGKKLNEEGTHLIQVIYEGLSAKFWITLEKPPVIKYNLLIISGTRQGQEHIEGNWEGEVVAGTRVTIEAIDKEDDGYIFDCWTEGGQVINRQPTFEYYVDFDATIIANYKERLHKVTFNSDGGSNISQQTARVIMECPEPTKNENVFIQWFDDDLNEPIVFPYYVTKDITLRAVWEPLGLEYIKQGSDTGYTVVGYSYAGAADRTTLEIPETLGEGEHNNLVLRIAQSAFESATSLTKITIPKTVATIEDYAFSECVNLSRIEVDEHNPNFRDIDGVLYNKAGNTLLVFPAGRMLTEYTVESDTLKIWNGAFYNANLGCLDIRSTLAEIGDFAFYSRTLSFIKFWGEAPPNTGYSQSLFHDNLKEIFILNVANSDSYINNLSFKPYRSKIIVDTNFPDLAIYESLMYRLVSRLSDDSTEQSLEIIGADRSIRHIIIPSYLVDERKVTSIGAYAFSYCYELEDVEFPYSMYVNRVLKGAFENTKWQTKYINNQIAQNGENWSGLLIINDMLVSCFKDKPVIEVPHTVSKICESSFSGLSTIREVIFKVDENNNKHTYEIHARAFQDCVNLSKIIIPKQVKILGERAFENTALYEFSFEENSELQTIGDYCFHNATKLTSFDIGTDVINIGKGAFNGCYSLERFSIDGLTTSNVGDNEYYITKEGVLFAFDKNITGDTDVFGRILHTYPSGRLAQVYELPSEGDTEGVTKILEFAFYYANVGAIVLPKTIDTIMADSIIVPNLLYLQYTANRIVGRGYNQLFPIFGPKVIVISDDDNSDYRSWWNEGNIISASDLDFLDIELGIIQTSSNQRYLYQKEGNNISIIGGPRAETELIIPSQITIDSVSYPITSIAGYAFMGNVVESIILPSSIATLKAYAFYYCRAIMSITSDRDLAPSLEYDEETQTDTVLSFYPGTIIENALVYVPPGREHVYSSSWPTTINYILEIGTQLIVNFDPQGGSHPVLINPDTGEPYDLDTLEVIHGSPVTERQGYEFAGWYGNEIFDGEPIVFPYHKYRKITLYARWQVKSYTVTYQLAGGSFEDEEQTSHIVYYDEMYTLLVPIKKGYNFIGWYDIDENAYTDADGQSLSEWKLTANIELIAKWQKKEIVVTYDANGGSTNEPTTTITYLAEGYTLEVPTKTGYEFLRWEDESGKYVTNRDGLGLNVWEYVEDITVTAVWRARQYEVSFDDGQGTEIPSVMITFDETEFTFNVPTKENSVFFGWYNGIGGTGIQYSDNQGNLLRIWDIAQNTTLYAQWPDDIAVASDFDNIRNKLEGSFILKNDIIIEGEWQPIGIDHTAPFTGILDGNGYSVYISSITSINENFIGFIGYNQGTIKDLNINIKLDKSNRASRAKIDIADGEYTDSIYIGGIAGFNDITGKIIDCMVAVEINTQIDITEEDSSLYIGGLVGYNMGVIQNTYLITEINTVLDENGTEPERMYKGALVGYHAKKGKIISCLFDIIVAQEQTPNYNPLGNSTDENRGGYFDTTGGTVEYGWE